MIHLGSGVCSATIEVGIGPREYDGGHGEQFCAPQATSQNLNKDEA
jgi:hypothetical protein